MAVEPEQVDAQKHHVNHMYFFARVGPWKSILLVFLAAERRIGGFPGKDSLSNFPAAAKPYGNFSTVRNVFKLLFSELYI